MDYVLNKYNKYLKHTIIIQLDCDEQLINSDYLKRVSEAYSSNNQLMVTTGPLHYHYKKKNNSKKTLHTGKQFRNTFYTKTLSKMFNDAGRDINDYLLPANDHKFFTGGNTTYRAILFTFKNVNFPYDNSWESVVISIRIQQHIHENQIKFIKEQSVCTSSRSFTNSRGILSPNKLKSIRKKGFIKPFKSNHIISPQETTENIIKQLDRETYGLSDKQTVVKVISENELGKYSNTKIIPMIHASKLTKIPNKYVLIN